MERQIFAVGDRIKCSAPSSSHRAHHNPYAPITVPIVHFRRGQAEGGGGGGGGGGACGVVPKNSIIPVPAPLEHHVDRHNTQIINQFAHVHQFL